MKLLLMLPIFMLSACCYEGSEQDCTARELAELKAKIKAEKEPEFVTEQDGIKIYRLWTKEPNASNHWTYFTTPCGDVSSTIQYRSGKTTREIQANTTGTGCSK